MRVERFFLFFGPTLWSFKRGETEYGIKSIPLGGYVKINGMNPEEEMPPGEEHRAYYRQKVWKRIVVARRGPGGEHRARLRDPLFAVFSSAGSKTSQPTVGEIEPGSPAAAGPAGGDRIVAVDGHAYAGLRRRRTDRKLRRSRSRSHKCAGKPTDGCRRETPVK